VALLSVERKERLEGLPGWVWNSLADKWDEGFRYLAEFAARTGHCRVSQGSRTADGYRLGQWVAVQRNTVDTLSPERKARLNALAGWSWNPHTDSWEEGLRYLTEFADRAGHVSVPALHRTADGYRLGQWVNAQRTNRNKLPTERRARLEGLPGWIWDVITVQWEDGFRSLVEFANREGHCLVNRKYKTEAEFRLGQWVTAQRTNRDNMPTERRARLEGLPGWIWDVLAAQWEDGFRYLEEFVEREDHARVLDYYKTEDGFQLGKWIGRQRSTRDSLTLERKARLEELPRWSWDARADKWEEGFRRLAEFAGRTGHCRVVLGYKTADDFPLGGWVNQQRHRRNSRTSAERKARLDALPGWSWGPHADRWEEGFRHLKEFADREGHCRVVGVYKTADGYRLGKWVGVQRSKKDGVSRERKTRLEALPGWVWKVGIKRQ